MVKNNRISVYAQSGRISLKTIRRIAKEHVSEGNKKMAIKTINELEIATDKDYKYNMDMIDDIYKQFQKKFNNRF